MINALRKLYLFHPRKLCECNTYKVVLKFSKRYNVTVDVYIREANPNEAFYELLYARAERAYQLLFNNQSKSTTVGGVTLNWVAGETSDVVLNELTNEESEIDGLNKISLDFSCLIER